jgi:hypothetical protein
LQSIKIKTNWHFIIYSVNLDLDSCIHKIDIETFWGAEWQQWRAIGKRVSGDSWPVTPNFPLTTDVNSCLFITTIVNSPNQLRTTSGGRGHPAHNSAQLRQMDTHSEYGAVCAFFCGITALVATFHCT